MGKYEQQNVQQQQQQIVETGNRGPSSFFCERCSMGLARVSEEFSLRCIFVLILSLSVFLAGFFWILPFHLKSGFDAKAAIKHSASVQGCFRLQKPVAELVPHIGQLEFDIYEEIGVPDTKVAILSMHQLHGSNWTHVVFGVLSDPINVPIKSVPLSVLRSSLIELFLQQSNLTLTGSIFGQPAMFEILKFPGGITVIPSQAASIWQIPQILFNFTLYNSISEIQANFVELRDQLKFGLHLKPYENVYVQVTNKDGSTVSSPVTVQASVMSDLGSLVPQRLKQLAQAITDSPAKNLGLDNSVFGKVKSIILSSYLKGTLDASPPTPLTAPSPVPSISPYPASPSYSPTPLPDIHYPPPCNNCEASSPSDHGDPDAPSPKAGPSRSFPPVSSSPPPTVAPQPPHPCPYHRPAIPPHPSPRSHANPAPNLSPRAQAPRVPPDLSPLPQASHGRDTGKTKGELSPSLAPSPLAESLSSLAPGDFYREIWLLEALGILILHLLCW